MKKEIMRTTYSDWSPTLSRLAHGTRVITSISASNLVSSPFTSVISAFVITAENSSCQKKNRFSSSIRQSHFQNAKKKKVKLNTLKWCCKISSFNQALKMKTKEKERRSDGSVRLPELQTCQLYQQIEGQSYLKHFQRAPLTKKHKRKKNKQKKQLELCNR
jgi:hypothetical protein